MKRLGASAWTVVAAASLVLCMAGQTVHAQDLPFFPGAEGYGGSFSGTAPANGWFSNATVYHVTNLNDSGPGSFRDAFDENSANKIVVFDVAGTIVLNGSSSGKVDIKNLANYYIAGQTAPGPVTVYNNMVQLTHSGGKENRNVILRYMTFRKGAGANQDSITFAGGDSSGVATGMILDHVTGSWSEDEILSVTNYNTNVTVQYSIIHDALVNNHAYGSLIRPKINSQVTFHHNLYANNNSRQARFGTYLTQRLTAEFVNNVVYNWRDRASYAGGSSESEQEYADVNYIGNYLIAGPGTLSNTDKGFFVDKNVTLRVYESGNFIDSDKTANPGGVPNGTSPSWVGASGPCVGSTLFCAFGDGSDQSIELMGSPLPFPPQAGPPVPTTTVQVTRQSALDAYWQVINYVGNFWWDRGYIDNRVIDNVLTNTGPPLAQAAPPDDELDTGPNAILNQPMIEHPPGYDTDGDAMPDDWEIAHGLNPNSAADQKLDFDNDGYINLIEFINEKGEFPATAPIDYVGPTSGAGARYALILNWKTNDGVSTGSYWQPSKYDVARIHSGTVAVDAVGQHAGTLLLAPDPGDNATLNVTAGWLDVTTTLAVGSDNGAATLNVSNGAMVLADAVLVGAMGTVKGNGSIFADIMNSGLVTPGASAGSLAVGGDFFQDADGVLTMELASASSYDELIVAGTMDLAGTLNVVLLGGYNPADGHSFDLFDFAGVNNTFDTLDLPALGGGLMWDTSQLYTTGTLSVTTGGMVPGDTDGDGDVDLDDYNTLSGNMYTNVAGGASDGDFDNDGDVDFEDFVIQALNFGDWPAAEETLGDVPEPTMLALLAAGLFTVTARRRSARVRR